MSDLVFLTGGTGYVGFRVLVDALRAGYRVRAAVRSQEKADKLLTLPSISALNPGTNLSFVVVPDILTDGAYDDAIRGATFAIHVASPLGSRHEEGKSYQETLIDPAIKGTLNLLEAAKKAGTLKRIVITSSVVAINPWADFISGKGVNVYSETSRTPFVPEPYHSNFEGYSASKVAALNEGEAWVRREREAGTVAFDVVHVFPSFVLGIDELADDAAAAQKSTNNVAIGPLTGNTRGPIPGSTAYLGDVAQAHVRALSPKIPGDIGGLIVSSGGQEGTRVEDIFEIAKREFPDAVAKGVLKGEGEEGVSLTLPIRYDTSRSEEVLGLKYTGWPEQTKEVIGWYLELLEKEGKKGENL